MIYELRTYTLMPGKQAEYLKLNGEIGRKIRGDKYGKLEGYWSTEFGTLNQLVHLWSYADLNERERETLTWAARGKTSVEIGRILGLAKRTVDFHIDNARLKLGATTRIHAAIKAATGHLIEP